MVKCLCCSKLKGYSIPHSNVPKFFLKSLYWEWIQWYLLNKVEVNHPTATAWFLLKNISLFHHYSTTIIDYSIYIIRARDVMIEQVRRSSSTSTRFVWFMEKMIFVWCLQMDFMSLALLLLGYESLLHSFKYQWDYDIHLVGEGVLFQWNGLNNK